MPSFSISELIAFCPKLTKYSFEAKQAKRFPFLPSFNPGFPMPMGIPPPIPQPMPQIPLMNRQNQVIPPFGIPPPLANNARMPPFPPPRNLQMIGNNPLGRRNNPQPIPNLVPKHNSSEFKPLQIFA